MPVSPWKQQQQAALLSRRSHTSTAFKAATKQLLAPGSLLAKQQRSTSGVCCWLVEGCPQPMTQPEQMYNATVSSSSLQHTVHSRYVDRLAQHHVSTADINRHCRHHPEGTLMCPRQSMQQAPCHMRRASQLMYSAPCSSRPYAYMAWHTHVTTPYLHHAIASLLCTHCRHRAQPAPLMLTPSGTAAVPSSQPAAPPHPPARPTSPGSLPCPGTAAGWARHRSTGGTAHAAQAAP